MKYEQKQLPDEYLPTLSTRPVMPLMLRRGSPRPLKKCRDCGGYCFDWINYLGETYHMDVSSCIQRTYGSHRPLTRKGGSSS